MTKTQLIRGLCNIKPKHQGAVLTIGNFDGIHIGHQEILKQTVLAAKERRCSSMVMLFEPQPSEYFDKNGTLPRLSRFREKYLTIAEYGVDQILCVAFNKVFSLLTAEAFTHEILLKKLAIRHLVIGDDFQFGRQRQGNYELLLKQQVFTVEKTHTYAVDNERVSSSKIRKALMQGDFSLTETLLGRPYQMSGRVEHGKKLGRLIGYPTANISLHRKISPITGIYAVRVFGAKAVPVFGVASIGTRPTVVKNGKTLLEVYLFNFDEEIYGRRLNVEFIHKIRDEEKFESIEALKAKIFSDTQIAKQLLGINHE